MNDFQAHHHPDEPPVRSSVLWVHVQAAAAQQHDAEAMTWERLQAALRRDAEARALAVRGRRVRGLVIAGTALAAMVALSFAVMPTREAGVVHVDTSVASMIGVSGTEAPGPTERADGHHDPSSVSSDATGDVSSAHGGLVADATQVAGRGVEGVLDVGAALVSQWSSAALSSVVAGFAAHTDTVVSDVRRSTRGQGGTSAADAVDPAELLAVAAEEALARGERSSAIGLLEKLVRKHSRSRQARAALLDLARLRNAAGDRDGAACAYRRFLERHPNDEMRPDVSRRLSDLARSELACDGIDPAK